MVDSLLDDWASDVNISRSEWDTALNRICDHFGVDVEDLLSISQFQLNHQVYEPGGFHNWTRLLPDDAVICVREAEDLQKTVLDISEETYNNIVETSDRSVDSQISHSDRDPSDYVDTQKTGRDALQAGQLADLGARIIGQFSGNVDLSRVQDGLPTSEEDMGEAPDFETTVLVHRRNERNLEDIAVFTVENGEEFFGDTFGDSTVMFELLRKSETIPDFVGKDVAFNSDGNAWGTSAIPDHEITIMSQDYKNRVYFITVSNPREVFAETWGDVSKMMSNLSDGDFVHQYNAGGIRWQVVLGL